MANYEVLISKGIIADWYLKESQLPLYDQIVGLESKRIKKLIVNSHRRYGKSTVVFTYIFERCLTEKDLVVRIGGVTEGTIKEIFLSIRNDIFQYAPKLKPDYSIKEGCFYFPSTNSGIHLFGNATQAEADKSRGSKAHIIYLDEFGFYRFDPMYYLKSVLSPQLDTTDGSLILTSTVPRDLTHPFINQIAEGEAGGYYYRWDILDSVKVGHVSNETHQQIIARCGGTHTDEYRREYLCELIPNTQYLVVPEATNESLYIGTQERPPFYDAYVGMDLGLRDHTSVIFGYYDFKQAKLVIEKEYWDNYKTTQDIVIACKTIEESLKHINKPTRYSDCELQQIFDMSNSFGYSVNPVIKRRTEADKRYVESLINGIRIAITEGRILIHPECKQVITQLKYGIWNDHRSDFERTETMGHLDALMALAYLWDMLDKTKNPYPNPLNGLSPLDYQIINRKEKSTFNKIF